MPPVKRAGGIVVEQAEDGRLVHTFRQSTIGELDICPERGRVTMTGEMPDVETDAACIGTAVHGGIEIAELSLMKGDVLPPDLIEHVAQAEFTRLMNLPNFEWKKYKEAKARLAIHGAIEVFYDELYHRIQPLAVEKGFGPLVIYEDSERVIQITGTIDLFDLGFGAADYKTDGDGRKYRRGFGGKAWELDRWAIQPKVYCEALRQMGYLDNQGPWPFTYLVFDISKPTGVELVDPTVWVRPEDIDWLRQKTLAYAKLVEGDVTPWPKQDNHALCSPAWCPNWDNCKGADYSQVEWPLRGH